MLCPVWKAPLVDMGDFGIGVGLYFTTLRFICVLTFLAGVIHPPTIAYVNSDKYSPQEGNRNSAIRT